MVLSAALLEGADEKNFPFGREESFYGIFI